MGAPSLRRHCDSCLALNIAHNSDVLPHLHLPGGIKELFLEAVAEPARRGESDETLAEEVRD